MPHQVTKRATIEFILSKKVYLEKVLGRVTVQFLLSAIGFSYSNVLEELSFFVKIPYLKETLDELFLNADIRWQGLEELGINANITCQPSNYSKLEVRPISDFVIKLDGTELEDVDLNTASITFKKGTNPSEATMTLARKHDNYDKTLAGVSSQISNENKIQIYDEWTSTSWKSMVGDLLNEPFDDKNDWTESKESGATLEISPAGQLHLKDTAGVNQNLGADVIPNQYTFEIKTYFDLLGNVNTDFFEIEIGVKVGVQDTALNLRFASDGLYINDGSTPYVKVTSTVKSGANAEWQTWRFVVDASTPASATCDVYLKDSTHNNELVAEDADCSVLEGTDGTVSIGQTATTVEVESHTTYAKLDTGLITTESTTTEKLLFTGYITQINADSTRDLVTIIAQDIRYKINKLSPLELYYGYYYPDEKSELEGDGKTIYANNKLALTYILNYLVSEGHLSDYESDFLDNFDIELEGRDLASNYGDLIETLVKECGTFDWYIDENEKLRFIKRGQGVTKTLSLSSLTSQRHIYDVIVDNVILNRKTPSYVKGYRVKFGKQRDINYWIGDGVFGHYIYSLPHLSDLQTNLKNVYDTYDTKDKTSFCFEYVSWWRIHEQHLQNPFYVGEGSIIGGIKLAYGASWIFWMGLYIYQVKLVDEETDITEEIVGDNSDVRDFDMSTHNRQIADFHYEEKKETDGTFFYKIEPANYDFREYAKDLANLELHRSNELLTTATVSLFLDAYLYYDLSFGNLINIDNTIEADIYNGNNEFPLDIDSITITLKDRITTLNLTNYSGSYFKRSVSYNDYIYNLDKETRMKDWWGREYKKKPLVAWNFVGDTEVIV